MAIIIASGRDREKWDDFIKSFDYPPLNNYAWKEVLEKTYKLKTFFFIALDSKNCIRGVLPTYINEDFKNRKRLYSLRYGLMADKNDTYNELLSYLKQFCKENNIVSNLITSGYQRIETDFQMIAKKTIVLELAHTEEDTWNRLKDKTRNLIRKSVKSGLTAERGFHNLRRFYNIYSLGMIEKEVSILSYIFFENITRKMPDNAELIVARKGNEIIAGILVLFSYPTAVYHFQASLKDYRSYAPNQFLIWEAIKSCIARGIPKLDMGESIEGGNVYLFKINFGGIPKDIYYYTDKENIAESKSGHIKKIGSLSFLNNIQRISPFWAKKKISIFLKSKGRII